MVMYLAVLPDYSKKDEKDSISQKDTNPSPGETRTRKVNFGQFMSIMKGIKKTV